MAYLLRESIKLVDAIVCGACSKDEEVHFVPLAYVKNMLLSFVYGVLKSSCPRIASTSNSLLVRYVMDVSTCSRATNAPSNAVVVL